MQAEKGTRKVRSDKKREVQPTISIELKEAIYRLSYITNTPVKDVAERICEDGILSRKVIEGLSQYFRRSVRLKNTMYMGDLERPTIQRKFPAGHTERIGIRFKQHTFENISALAYALDCTPSRATSLLLEASLHDSDFINKYFHDHLKQVLDERRMAELKKVLKYINTNNPYDEKLSWGLLLSYLYEEIKDGAGTVSESITTFINKWR
ncbi:hypothetical protein [Sporosarcina sp. BP05]|uniref:hypothetical protein n=1 Tax=Sporosarcina sp. BP05 TaxID=2758726 RepID=UPI001648EC07|nr:hypothetical protein [Sporosarcina sp. BP05]